MDCNMPVMDGFEATTKIRKIAEIDQSRLFITALTANARDDVKEESLRVGMNDILTKPVSLEQLENMLRKVQL